MPAPNHPSHKPHPSLSKIEALHGSYLAIALPPSSGENFSTCSSRDNLTLHGSGAGLISTSDRSVAVRQSDGSSPAPALADEKAVPFASAGARMGAWGHADAAAAAALLMTRRAGEIELPGGGRTRVRVGLCSGVVCCAVIGADRPRFR
jgi:hypothetical protein